MTLEDEGFDNSYDPATWGKYPSDVDDEGNTFFHIPDSHGDVKIVYPGLSMSDDPVEAADEQTEFEKRCAEGPLFRVGTRWVSPIEQLGREIEEVYRLICATPEMGRAIGEEVGFWLGFGTVRLAFDLLERLFGGGR